MKAIFIGGNFDDEGGRPSGYCKKLSDQLTANGCNTTLINGGSFSSLEKLIAPEILTDFDCIFWFANVPNNKKKIVRDIKSIAPRSMLITSKANYDNRYCFQDLIARALQNKSNLLVEFTKKDNSINARVIDPLGNLWTNGYDDSIVWVARVIVNRLKDLLRFKRAGCINIGKGVSCEANNKFIEIIKFCGNKFHDIIHGANTSRFLGNSSFRCTKGFPSFRYEKELIYVSKRNIDKRELASDGFVACDLDSFKGGSKVKYYGEHKPSVDTPVQIILYNFYTNINFMLHSHVYVENAPFTKTKIPCGALEEADAIIETLPFKDINMFAINLKGHGSLIAANTIDQLEKLIYSYIARPEAEM